MREADGHKGGLGYLWFPLFRHCLSSGPCRWYLIPPLASQLSSPVSSWPLVVIDGTGSWLWRCCAEMSVVFAPHPLGCGKAHLTVLGKTASIRRVLPMGLDYFTDIRRPRSRELSRQQNESSCPLRTHHPIFYH